MPMPIDDILIPDSFFVLDDVVARVYQMLEEPQGRLCLVWPWIPGRTQSSELDTSQNKDMVAELDAMVEM